MKTIEELLESTDLDELRREWQERADLKAHMVGQLYPGILQAEMLLIQVREAAIKYPPKP